MENLTEGQAKELWEQSLDGWHDDVVTDIDGTSYFVFENPKADTVSVVWQDSQGFLYGRIYDTAEWQQKTEEIERDFAAQGEDYLN